MKGFGFVIIFGSIFIDQLTKYVVVHIVMSPPLVIEVTSFFNIVMVWNRGASFGLFSTTSIWVPTVLVVVASCISIFLIIWMLRSESRLRIFALALVIGGAIGNVIDRIVYGAVADFLDFHAFEYHWPAFNVADISISCGVIMLLYDGLILGRRNHTFDSRN